MGVFPRNGNVLHGTLCAWPGRLVLAVLFVLACASARADYLGPVDAAGVRDMVSEARGRVVVVNFWASWCAPCRAEMPLLLALRDAYSEDDLLLVGVSVDFDAQAARAYAEEAGLDFPVYVAHEDVFEAFSVDAIPKTMIWDRQGNLAMDQVGLLPPDALHETVGALVQ